MEIIKHRINSIELLMSTPTKFGIEIDIRTYKDELILNHDPYQKGIFFSNWIKYYKHGTMIINVKEDGLENKILSYLKKYKIKSFFFLDQAMPSLINISNNGESNCAMRVSEYESIETALNFKDKIKWIWVDMFTKFPLKFKDFTNLKSANFKLCLVSPELQPFNKLQINEVKKILDKENIYFDAVCTKFPEKWKEGL